MHDYMQAYPESFRSHRSTRSNLKYARDFLDRRRPHTFSRSEESRSKQLLLCTITVWTHITITACLLVQVDLLAHQCHILKCGIPKRHHFLSVKQVLMNRLGNDAGSHEAERNNGKHGNWQRVVNPLCHQPALACYQEQDPFPRIIPDIIPSPFSLTSILHRLTMSMIQAYYVSLA